MPNIGEIIIDYKGIIKGISSQIKLVWETLKASSNEDVRKEIDYIKGIEVSDEQSFLKQKNIIKEQGYVYIIVKFGSGSINYGSSVCPIYLTCQGTANRVKPVQLLISVFSSSWTTKNIMQGLNGEISNVLQVWNTPEVLSNFNEENIEFRNLIRISGNIVVGRAAVRIGTITYIYDEEAESQSAGSGSEVVDIMSFQDGYHASLDSQPFGNTNGFSISEVNFSTYTFSISTYMLDTHLAAAMLSIRGFRNRTSNGIGAILDDEGHIKTDYFNFKQNDKMKIKLSFTNGYNNIPLTNETSGTDTILGDEMFSYFKVVDSRIGQEIAGLPSLVITFTR